MGVVGEQSPVMALEGLGELVEEVDELLGSVAGQFQRQADESVNSQAFFPLARRCGECGFSNGVTGADDAQDEWATE